MASESQLKSSCILQSCLNCGGNNKPLITAGPEILCSIVEASKCRGDGLHLYLEPMVHDCGSSTLLLHRNCVSTYTSKTHIKRFLSRQNRTPDEPVVKRTCSLFNFKEHCLICGEKCCPKPDPKHPNIWRCVIQCRAADRGPNQSIFKDVIISACDLRNDDWGQQVRLRVDGAVSDLHAAGTQYHKDSMSSFRHPRNIKSSVAQKNEMTQDKAFMCVVGDLREVLSRIWNSIEVHNLYKFYKGESLTRRQLIRKLAEHFRQDLLIFSGTGVESIHHRLYRHRRLDTHHRIYTHHRFYMI